MLERGAPSELPPPPAPRDRIYSRIRLFAVVLTALLICLEVVSALKLTGLPYDGVRGTELSIARVAGDSPAAKAGLRKGDEIVSMNGIPCASFKDMSNCLAGLGPGDEVVYGIQRGQERLTVKLTLSRMPLSEILRKLSLLVVGFSFMAIGLLVYFKRTDKVALVFYLFCLAFGFTLTGLATTGPGPTALLHKSAVSDLLELLPPVLFLHFFLLFPERRDLLEAHPRIEYLIYAPAAALFLISVYFNVMVYSFGRTYAGIGTLLRNVTGLHFFIFVVLGLVAFFYAYRHTRSHSMKRNLKLVVWGTVVGILPIVLVAVLLSIRPEIELPGEQLAFLPLVLVPVAFGHAIVRHGLFDVEIVVKRSLVYTLLIAVLASIYFAVVYGIGRLASRFVGSPELPFSIISIFVITLLISPLRARIRLAVDRMFFRQEYNYRKVLKQISHSLAGIISLESLVSYLGIRVPEVLNARTAVIYLLNEKTGRFTPRYGHQVNHSMLKGIDQDGSLSSHLLRTETAFNVERAVESKKPLPITEDEAGILTRTETALVVPFIFKSSLLGFMTLGRKMSDEFYSVTDVELLETLCDQAALAFENTKLYLETVEKQKMERELEVAREIQRRLLPKTFPEIPGFRTHAVNLPSKHVGGDYFDIIPLGRTRVAVTIADVSGKGVPAALLMASLQSSLRAEAEPARPPSSVISALNRVIFDHTSGGTFVTIFYGVIDLAEATLTYCNAGQTPPIIMDENSGVRKLDETDIVIGIDDTAQYRDTTVDINEGDLIFLYTDGITDELNERDEPYGERRLIEQLKQTHRASLKEMTDRIQDGIIRYTGGRFQDDLTVLAIRVVELTLRKGSASVQGTHPKTAR